MRTGTYYKTKFGPASVRTRELEALIPLFAEKLKEEFDAALVAKTMELFVRAKAAEDDSDITDGQDTENVPRSAYEACGRALGSERDSRALRHRQGCGTER